ncbi:MAG: hypothetical protein ACLP3K_16910 [Candidatus Acidiferrales bacterium]
MILDLPGLPPNKEVWRSIRNRRHPRHLTFVVLRKAAADAMAGRAWYFGPVELRLTVYGSRPLNRWGLNDYLGGVMDTLDGSSGETFTYLPIIFEDDCQVTKAQATWVKRAENSYRLKIVFK